MYLISERKKKVSMEINKNYQLNNLAIDEISNEAEKYLTSIKMEKKNLLRIRLIIEEMLLDWQSFFSEEAVCQVKMGQKFGRPYISLDLEGASYNPLDKNESEFGLKYYNSEIERLETLIHQPISYYQHLLD